MPSEEAPACFPDPDAHVVAALSSEGIAALRRDLLASVHRACPAWLQAQAEDIVQTALIRLVGIAATSGGTPPFSSSYLKRAAFNAVVDEIRRCLRRSEVQEGGDVSLAVMPSLGPDQEARASASQIRAGLTQCLRGMIASRRQTVVCHLQGYSVPETARFLGWSAKKVEHLVIRGLNDLRTCMSDKGLTP